MNTTLLIDAIVRQTTVLVAALATSAGHRAPLAHVADQVFADLVRELHEQGLRTKVIADMFGMALRTYQARVARLSESSTDRGHSLWEAVYRFVQTSGPVSRSGVLAHFHADNESVLRSVLRDLVDSGLVYRSGRGDTATYKATASDEQPSAEADVDALVLVAVHRGGTMSEADLLEALPLDATQLRAALVRLSAQGLLIAENTGPNQTFRCERCVIPLGAHAGWEAAVFDHYQAMVAALVSKLRGGGRRADLSDKCGGSTFTFDVWPTHPLTGEVLDYLATARRRGLELRQKIDAHNDQHHKPADEAWMRVVAYVGQMVREEDEDDERN